MSDIIEFTDVYNQMIGGKIVVTKIKRKYISGFLVMESYLNEENQLHRDANSYYGDGPAEIRYTRDNKNHKIIIHEMWYKNGRTHRDNNLPAVISYSDDGKNIVLKEWYIDGYHVSETGGIYCNLPPVGVSCYDDDTQIVRLVKAIRNLNMEDLDKCIKVIESFKK